MSMITNTLPYFFLKKSNKKTRILQSPLEKIWVNFKGPQ